MELQTNLFQTVKSIILQSRERVFRMANSVLLNAYWQIGKLIVEDKQKGNIKAEYGKATLKTLSQQLTMEFGKGFDYTNLTNMRKFYQAFPILDALRTELSWTHYRLLSRVETDEKRNYYLTEAIENNLFASKYLLYLPKEEELKALITQDRLNFNLDNEQYT